ncbi:hypothetical protein [Bacillus cereus]|uniref:hypothetical protein n=1 Tax=Bacillus cereus TaxID=1396 RepID=UPI001495F3DC|nr:hypothetical protein [Bacillus cereus]QKE10628.1 hypothetical protein HPG46_27730 [Bacillus cereus]
MENYFVGEIVAEWKVFIPIVSALLGVIGTLIVQCKLKKMDIRKQNEKEINSFKGRLGNLLRKIDFCMRVDENIKPIDLEKDRAVRILKEHFIKFEVYKNLIEKLNENEEHFEGKKVENKIRKINDNLWQISIYMYQIDNPNEQKDMESSERIYQHNLELYKNIKNMCEEIKLLKEGL